MKTLLGTALTAAVIAAAPIAQAASGGWSAVQTSASPGSQIEQRAEISYGHHRLRVDNPGQRLIIDFASGALLYIDIGKKQYARVTLEEMVALREKQVKTVKAQLDKLPPQIRAQMEAQIEAAEKSSTQTIDARRTGTSDQVNGVACDMFAWSSSDGEGRACIAKDLPFDAQPFRKDSLQLSKKMVKLGAGSAASSMAILQLGEHGFPVLIDQKLDLGANRMSVVSTFEKIRATNHPQSYFAAPKGFEKRDFEKMMTEAVSSGPRMPAPTP